ncbi:MAG: sigma 54-interacting transcriptional regulator [Candidatus Sumerlaeia bacterium]|nr:sigma 54-interacting transcriptional regulator [Candidatus Sumerlaeia bacterium]
MAEQTNYRVEFDSLRDLLRRASHEPTVGTILDAIVKGMGERGHLARACVWMEECMLAQVDEEFAAPNFCGILKLVACSLNHPPGEEYHEWTHRWGDFSRVPPAEPLIGQIVKTKQAHLYSAPAEWPEYPEWAQRGGIQAMHAVPMIMDGTVYGVLAVFVKMPTHDFVAEGARWLGLFADQVTLAIENRRDVGRLEREKQRAVQENEYLREEIRETRAFGKILGNSPGLRRALQQIEMVAPTDATVLILGESGSGKELIASEIHGRSSRADRSFVKVNCASIPRELFESEFFGHVKGSFTGAVKDRIGRFQLAHGGTLFLDEVGEIPMELQSKLLRVLQEGEFERVGEDVTKRVNVRLIAATNRDLKKEVSKGRFRQDLYYRLGVFPLELPPLRERLEDIPTIAAAFLERACKRFGRKGLRLADRHVMQLQNYVWPGNIRELQNVIERAVITSVGDVLELSIPDDSLPASSSRLLVIPREDIMAEKIYTYTELEDLERANIVKALKKANGKISGPGGAAELVDSKPTTLASRIKALGIDKEAVVQGE